MKHLARHFAFLLSVSAVVGVNADVNREEAPPVQLVVTAADGTEQVVEAGGTFTAPEAGDYSVAVAPTRRLMLPGASFEYPTSMSYAYDDSDPEAVSWELNGNDALLMIFPNDADAIAGDLLVSSYVAGIGQILELVDTQPAKPWTVAGEQLKGTSVSIDAGGGMLVEQSAYAFTAGQTVYLIVIQNASAELDRGEESPEVESLRDLVGESMKIGE